MRARPISPLEGPFFQPGEGLKDGLQIGPYTFFVAAEKGAQFEVFHDGEGREDAPPFRDLGDARPDDVLGFQLVERLAAVQDGAVFRMEKPRYSTEGGRLAGAVGADERDDLALIHFE